MIEVGRMLKEVINFLINELSNIDDEIHDKKVLLNRRYNIICR